MLVRVRVRVRVRVLVRAASANEQCDGSATGRRGQLWLGSVRETSECGTPEEVMLDVGEDSVEV